MLKLYPVTVKLVEGRGGIFEITYNAVAVFSKSILGRFPTNTDLKELNFVIDFNN